MEFKEDDDRFEYHSPPLKYIVMKPVENGECILENTRTVTDLGGEAFPSVRISLELAVKDEMGMGDSMAFILRKIICWF